MSQFITESFSKSRNSFQHIESLHPEKEHNHASKHGVIDYLQYILPKSSLATTALTAETVVEFELDYTPALMIKDNDSIFLLFKCTNTDADNTVTPTFVEAFLNQTAAVEFWQSGRQIGITLPMIQAVLEPAMKFGDIEYTSLCTQLNHNTALAYNSGSTAIATSGSANYYLRLPTILPPDGFWLGALSSAPLSIRIKTAVAKAAGSGTIAISATDGIQMILDCVTIPQSEWGRFHSEWVNKHWHTQYCVLNQPPSQITTVSSGDSPDVKLEAFKDIEISHMLTILHASRSMTANAYFNWLAAPSTSSVQLLTKDKNLILSSGPELMAWNKYIRGTKQSADSKFFYNTNAILHNPCGDLQARIHIQGHDEGKLLMTGEEYIRIKDYGSATAMYVDTIAFVDAYVGIMNGEIHKHK
jgi:phosphoribosylformylglycinamidine (FGAM) synthase-like amidotransferase family enzyme